MKALIKFGTDGWRAIIAKDYTVENVKRVSVAVATWLKQRYDEPTIVIGHDCRFGGKMFMEEAAKVFIAHGVTVYYHDGFVSTPMISMATLQMKSHLGVVITASHNPPNYNGYKLKGAFGGPMLPEHVEEVERLIPDGLPDLPTIDLNNHTKYVRKDFKRLYVSAIKNTFDLDAIYQSPFRFAYDAMYGTGQGVMKELFPNITLFHCSENPSFEGVAPEPILRNLQPFATYIRESKSIDCGLATDGDADRIGLFDEQGNFVDSHHIILLLIHYLVKYKGMKGKVITAFSVSEKVKKICTHYGLEQITTPIGFKYITRYMIQDDVLLGGEESGGIAVKGHIPERDGIWMGLIIWEYMAKSGKTLQELIQEVYAITGAFAYDRLDLHLTEEQKQRIVDACKKNKFEKFGNYKVKRIETIDGYKFHFDDEAWLLIRASGTEPVLRIYAETGSAEETKVFLEAVKEVVMGV